MMTKIDLNIISNIKPQTEKSLLNYIKVFLGYKIPNKSVCKNHNTPFGFLTDVFFEKNKNIIGFASRGSGKTLDVAIIHFLNSKFKPGCDTATVGAIESQAKRCYDYFSKFCRLPIFQSCIAETRLGDTVFKNGSRVEILTGTVRSLNSPHPSKAFLDEVELVDWNIYQEFLNMAQDKENIISQNILTSTRKYSFGTMQRILDEAEILNNYKVYTWCIWEVAKQCKKSSCEDCKKITKGDKNFFDVCQMKMKYSNGFVSFQDVVNRFLLLDDFTWKSQQECLGVERTGLVYKWFNKEKHIGDFKYDSNYQIYEGLDFGGVNPSACIWVQKVGNKLFLLDEIYKTGIAPSDFGKLILQKRQELGIIKQPTTYCDPSGKDCILELRKLGIVAKGVSSLVENGISMINSLGENDLIFIDRKCKNFVVEILNYHYAENKTEKNLPEQPVKSGDHLMDAFRYCVVGMNLKPEFSFGAIETKPKIIENPDKEILERLYY